METERVGKPLMMFSGRFFWPKDPRVEEVHVEDIAHNLSHECRFCGAVRSFYCVAQHSVLVAETVASWLNDPTRYGCDACWKKGNEVVRPIAYYSETMRSVSEGSVRAVPSLFCEPCGREDKWARRVTPEMKRDFVLAALLHDGSEAYLRDMPRPVKHEPEFEFYRIIERKVQSVVYRAFKLDEEEPALVKLADDVLCDSEQRDLRPSPPGGHRAPERVLPYVIEPVSAEVARAMFLNKFEELTRAA